MPAAAVLQPGPEALAYNIISLVWVLSFLVETALIRSGGERSSRVKADRGSAPLILVSIFLSLGIANAISMAQIGILPEPFLYLGLLMMLSGIAVRFWAVFTLKSFFSYTVQIKTEHRVIDSGPYRFVRHPAYAGSFLTIIGVGFALQSWVAILALAFVFFLTFGYRIRVEERLLAESLGEEYRAYSKRVKRLIPYVF